jgi:hypothetical protein
MREPKESNDIFFVCSFIEYLARATKNKRRDIINNIGYKNIKKLYEYADVYHCENIDELTDNFIQKYDIKQGNFDNTANCVYSVPDFWDIGRVYNNLIADISDKKKSDELVDILFEVYNSWIADYIDDYNSNMYYSNPGYIYQS